MTSSQAPPKPVTLIVLDGFGESEEVAGNAIRKAKMPHLTSYKKRYPSTLLEASGEAVGLSSGMMGSSEVGHLTLGAGRVIYQSPERIRHSIEDGSFQKNDAFLKVLDHVRKNDSALHLMGLVSDSGVHSHLRHLVALLELAASSGIREVLVHLFSDGRDSPPTSGKYYLAMLDQEFRRLRTGRVVTISGRYYTMDRDQRWDRTQRAYDAIALGKGEQGIDPLSVFEQAYAKNVTDEFIAPTVIGSYQGIGAKDAVIFFNFRADRARQLTQALTESSFKEFLADRKPALFCSMTRYYEEQRSLVAFAPLIHTQILGEILSSNRLMQLRAAETEKFAHVTYFFNGGSEQVFSGEDRILVPSSKVATYDLEPEMSAHAIADSVVSRIHVGHYDFVLVNFANPDMVGHTGNLNATVKALECVDICVHKIVEATLDAGGVVLLTADHGNCEHMVDGGAPHTSHTTNLVPCILLSPEGSPWTEVVLRKGSLANVAPTILKILGLPRPKEMTDPLF